MDGEVVVEKGQGGEGEVTEERRKKKERRRKEEETKRERGRIGRLHCGKWWRAADSGR